MTTFREEVLKRYMAGLDYKSRSTGGIFTLKEIRTQHCGNNCSGPFGDCDGTQLIFTNGATGCVFDLDENTRFELATEIIRKTNVRW